MTYYYIIDILDAIPFVKPTQSNLPLF